MRHYILLIVLLSNSIYLLADKTNDKKSFNLSIGGGWNNNSILPFWLISNQFGYYDKGNYHSFASINYKNKGEIYKDLSYFYKISPSFKYNESDTYFELSEVYGGIQYKAISIFAGKRYEIIGNQDSIVSSGGMLWSGNASPFPKINAGIFEYTSIPFTYNLLEIKGGLSNGWLTEAPYRVKNSMVHHKFIYFRAGGKYPLKLHYGFHHFVQWGGYSSDSTFGQLPSNFSSFIDVFLARAGRNLDSALWMESDNRLGNHLGSRNFGIEYIGKQYQLLLYWQTIFEDNSGLNYRNISDGLWGISVKKTDGFYLKHFCIEYIRTTNQSGPTHDATATFEGGGNDNYFNNGVYPDGWSYRTMGIGSPFITSPIYASANASFFNNRVIAGYLSLLGNINTQLSYDMRCSYSQNYGTFSLPYIKMKEQYSAYIKVNMQSKKFKQLEYSLLIATDAGNHLENNIGAIFIIKKKFTSSITKRIEYATKKSFPITFLN